MQRRQIFAIQAMVLFLLWAPQAAQGTVFFAAAHGSPTGDGSKERPWDLQTALRLSTEIGPDDTLYLMEGVYRTAQSSPRIGASHRARQYRGRSDYFISDLSGLPGRYVTVRPYAQHHVVIDGGVVIEGSWVVFRDLEVMSSDPKRLTSQPGSFPSDIRRPEGFRIASPHVKIINNIIHDSRIGITAFSAGWDVEIYGNLIYFVGWQAPDRAHGHGIYAQNRNDAKIIEDNIIFNNFRHGLQIYGSERAFLDRIVLEGNILFNNGFLASSGASRNILFGGGRSAESPVIRENYAYYPLTYPGDNNIGFWPDGTGCRDLLLEDNYFASGGRALVVHRCTVRSMAGNTVYGDTGAFDPSRFPDNQFISAATSPPPGVAFVRPNRYEAGRAHIAIFNWERREVVNVDISAAGLRPGDRYALHSVQDYRHDVTIGTYTGDPIPVKMSGRTVETPQGWEAPVSTFPEFGAFVLMRIDPSDLQ